MKITISIRPQLTRYCLRFKLLLFFTFSIAFFIKPVYAQNLPFTFSIVGTVVTSDTSKTQPYTSSTSNSMQVIQLQAKKPPSGSRIMLYPFLKFSNPNGDFNCQVDKSNLKDTLAFAGIMVRQSIESTKNYCFLGIAKNNWVIYEQQINGQKTCCLTVKMPSTTNALYIKTRITNGLVSFYVAPQLYANISDWLLLGSQANITGSCLVGPVLIPLSASTMDVAKFTNFQNGWGTPVSSPGLGKIAVTNNNFDALMTDLINNHSARMANDPNYATLFTQMQQYRNSSPEFTINTSDSEVTKITKASCNAELYIADILTSRLLAGSSGTPSYKYNPQFPKSYKLYYTLNLLTFLQEVQTTVSDCDNVMSGGWKDIGLITICNATANVIVPGFGALITGLTFGLVNGGTVCEGAYKYGQYQQCTDGEANVTRDLATYQPDINTRDRIVLRSAEYIVNLAILSYLSKPYSDSCYTNATQFSGQLKELMNFLHTAYQDNNIPIHAYSAIALLELVAGTKTTISTLNPMIAGKFSTTGGYSEGTAYLNEVLYDLVPLYYFGIKTNLLSLTDTNYIKPSVLNSGKWLLNISDAGSGNIPAVDDSREFIPWLAPFAFLNNDTKYLDYTKKFCIPIMGYAIPTAPVYWATGTARRFLTYPANMYTSTPSPIANPDVSYNDGVGKIHFKDGTADVNISIIAENGLDLSGGNSHDQQDNGSITINRTTSPTAIDRLILDPGYAGFAKRNANSLYQYHNVVLLNGSGVNPNGTWTDADIKTMIKNAFSINQQFIVDSMFNRIKPLLFGSGLDKTASTAAGYLDQTYTNGMMISQSFNNPSNTYNDRAIITYDGEVIIADNIHSGQNKYGVHWNLPTNSVQNPNNILTGSAGSSQIRLSAFSQDQGNMFVHRASGIHFPQEGAPDLTVDTLTASNSESTYSACFSYLTICEPKASSINLGTLPTYSTISISNASVCITKNIASEGITRYIFVNKDGWNAAGSITINGISTNAMLGVLDFKIGTNTLDNVLVYHYTTLTNNGVSLISKSGEEFSLKKTINNQTINTNTTVSTGLPVTIRNVTVPSPTSLNVTSGKNVYIGPETVFPRGSNVKITIDPTIK